MWIHTGVTVRKRLSGVLTSVTLTSDLWPCPFAWTSLLSLVIIPEIFMMIWWWDHSEKGVTDRRTDGRTEWTIHRAAWSQAKTPLPICPSVTNGAEMSFIFAIIESNSQYLAVACTPRALHELLKNRGPHNTRDSVSPAADQLAWDFHDDVIKWKHFPRNWPFVWGIHRWPVNSPHKGQWRGALIFSLICAWINGWVNSREAGDLRRHRAHYHVIVMFSASDAFLSVG